MLSVGEVTPEQSPAGVKYILALHSPVLPAFVCPVVVRCVGSILDPAPIPWYPNSVVVSPAFRPSAAVVAAEIISRFENEFGERLARDNCLAVIHLVEKCLRILSECCPILFLPGVKLEVGAQCVLHDRLSGRDVL